MTAAVVTTGTVTAEMAANFRRDARREGGNQ